MDLLQLPLWNSAFFAQRAKSRVQENQFRTFYIPRMAKQGILWVGVCATAPREINPDIIPLFPPSYRAFYVKCLVSYIDAAAGRDPLPVMPRLPGIDVRKLSSVLHARRGQLQAEERQPTEVWAALHSQQVPYKLREFVTAALWCKLPVAQHLQTFGVLNTDLCPLCGVVENHAHVQKKCFFLQDSLALIRRLWGVYVVDNVWYEPSRLCHPLLSVTTV